MAKQKRLEKQWAKRPPNFRTTLPEKRCGNCKHYGADMDGDTKCQRYPNFSRAWDMTWHGDADNSDKQVCDDWREDK